MNLFLIELDIDTRTQYSLFNPCQITKSKRGSFCASKCLVVASIFNTAQYKYADYNIIIIYFLKVDSKISSPRISTLNILNSFALYLQKN